MDEDEECEEYQETLTGLKLHISDLESQLFKSRDEFARLAETIPELTHRDGALADDDGSCPSSSSFIIGEPEEDEGWRDAPAGEGGREPPTIRHDSDWDPAAPLDSEMEPVLPHSSSPPRNPFAIGGLDDETERALAWLARPKGYTSRARQTKILTAACALVLLSAGGLAAFGGGEGNAGPGGAAAVTKSDSSCVDDPSFVHAGDGRTCLTLVEAVGPSMREWGCNRPAGDPRGDGSLVKHFCRRACGMCGEGASSQKLAADGGTGRGGANAGETDSNVVEITEVMNVVEIGRAPSEQPIPSDSPQELAGEGEASLAGTNAGESNSDDAEIAEGTNVVEIGRTPPEHPVPSDGNPSAIDEVCEDDPTYFRDDGHLGKGHTCATFVEHVGRPKLLDDRCNKTSMIMGVDGEELPVKHFCRHSCGMCDVRL